MDDRRLIQGFLAGDLAAVSQLDAWIREVVQNHYWGLREQWDDITQDVHRKLIENFRRPRFEAPRSLRLYIYRVAQFTCLDYLRRRYRQPEYVEVTAELHLVDERFSLDLWVEEIDEERLFFKLFHALPDECRQLWRLFFLEGHSYQEIARRLKIAEGTVRVRFYRCKQTALRVYRRLAQVPAR